MEDVTYEKAVVIHAASWPFTPEQMGA